MFDPVPNFPAGSGSASAPSAQQIDAAIEAGFEGIAIDASALVDGVRSEETSAAMVKAAVALLTQGQSVILHIARGPNDPRIGAPIESLVARGETRDG